MGSGIEGSPSGSIPNGTAEAVGVPYNEYEQQDRKGKLLRKETINGMRERIDLGAFDPVLVSSSDALDSVLWPFLGLAVKKESVAVPPDGSTP